MVELKVRLGAKGQIVIPKILREAYKLYPQEEVIIKEVQEGVLIKKPANDIIERLREIAKKVNEKKKVKYLDGKRMKEMFHEQYEKRARISVKK